MPERTIRRADDPETRAKVFEIGRVTWDASSDPSQFLARMLACPRRHRATGWLVEEEGRPVAGLLAYPLTFSSADGTAIDGVGLGAVATMPENRKRGHADALCRKVLEDAEQRGAPLALLFSEIKPEYYARMGFEIAAGWEHLCTDLPGLAASTEAAPWQPLDPRTNLESIGDLYARDHAGNLHLRRDAEGWKHSLARNSNVLWLGLGDPLVGYARVSVEEHDFYFSELMLREATPEAFAAALAGLAKTALLWRCSRITCWLPPSQVPAPWFREESRGKTLPMVRGTDEGPLLRVWGSDYF
ncbi:MAG: putative N-acetyltransferase YhbS [Planctomycetota bacterium]|jgi:predicted N-acetyltransferase YhbS